MNASVDFLAKSGWRWRELQKRLLLVGRDLGRETCERQRELQEHVYARNKGTPMRLVDIGRFSTFRFSDNRCSPCALIGLYYNTVQRSSVANNTVG